MLRISTTTIKLTPQDIADYDEYVSCKSSCNNKYTETSQEILDISSFSNLEQNILQEQINNTNGELILGFKNTTESSVQQNSGAQAKVEEIKSNILDN